VLALQAIGGTSNVFKPSSLLGPSAVPYFLHVSAPKCILLVHEVEVGAKCLRANFLAHVIIDTN
jgi:hypothetical protein